VTEGSRPAVRPIFILSLPRTGSTLLQRILGSHEAIATASEPWFLLPSLYSLREQGVNAEYEHGVTARGVKGFAEEYLPGGVDDYRAAIHDFALDIYARASDGKPYFLDKTPRYHHIAGELISLFQEARFIFLWRNPLAIAASWMDTWSGGRWNLDDLSADLFRGLPNLVEAYSSHEDRVASTRYEDLVARPPEEIERLLHYLELPFDATVLERFRELEMRNPAFWDPTGTRRYREITGASLAKWRTIMANPIRKAWCRRYLRWLGPERLAVMGYRLDELLAEVDAIPLGVHRLPSDLTRGWAGFRYRRKRSKVVGVPFPLWQPPD
jgi:Sulfotransferase family